MTYRLIILILALLYSSIILGGSNADSLMHEYRKTTDLALKADIIGPLVSEYWYIDLDTSLILSEELYEIGIQLNNNSHVIQGIYSKGVTYYYKGDQQEALTYFLKTDSLIDLYKDSTLLSDAYGGIANCYLSMGEFAKALDYTYKGIKLAQKFGNQQSESQGFYNVGNINRRLKNYKEAVNGFLKSLAISTKMQDEVGMAHIHSNLANVYRENGDFEKAISHYKSGKKLSIKHNLKRTLATNTNNIGLLYMQQKQYDTALVYFYESFDVRKALDEKLGICYSMLNLGKTYSLMNQLDSAHRYLVACVNLSNNLKLNQIKEKAHYLLSAVYERNSDFKNALYHYKQFTIVKDSLFNESKSKELGKLEATYEMEKKIEEEKRQKQVALELQQKKKQRRDNLQYSGIFVVVLVLFALVFMSGKFTLSERFAEGLIFFTFLLFFEFMLVLLDPLIEEWSGGQPAYKLVFNAILAAGIFPLHSFFEAKLKSKLLNKE